MLNDLANKYVLVTLLRSILIQIMLQITTETNASESKRLRFIVFNGA